MAVTLKLKQMKLALSSNNPTSHSLNTSVEETVTTVVAEVEDNSQTPSSLETHVEELEETVRGDATTLLTT